MRSGKTHAVHDLRVIIEGKRHLPSRTYEIVSEASDWVKAALEGAGVNFSYASCEEEDHYGFAAFRIIRSNRGGSVILDLKVAEIRDTPYIFAEVRSVGRTEGSLFPFFGNIRSEDGRDLLLHYIADFLMSTET